MRHRSLVLSVPALHRACAISDRDSFFLASGGGVCLASLTCMPGIFTPVAPPGADLVITTCFTCHTPRKWQQQHGSAVCERGVNIEFGRRPSGSPVKVCVYAALTIQSLNFKYCLGGMVARMAATAALGLGSDMVRCAVRARDDAVSGRMRPGQAKGG